MSVRILSVTLATGLPDGEAFSLASRRHRRRWER